MILIRTNLSSTGNFHAEVQEALIQGPFKIDEILFSSPYSFFLMSAIDLKAEGNALFAKGQWVLASVKYTDAITLDNENAVLWANRAACRLHLKQ